MRTAELQVIRVVGAAIRNERGEYLVAQRGEAMNQSGLWEFPGGKIEPGESPAEALVREIREELQIEIRVLDWIGVGMAKIAPHKQIRLDVYLAELIAGAPIVREHAAIAWLPIESFDTVAWCPPDVPIVERMKASST